MIKFFMKLFKKKKDLREFGADYVEEFLDKYDKINMGVPIGGLQETIVFLDLVETIKKEWEK